MSYSIGCDAHKRYSLFAVLNSQGKLQQRQRINHERGAIMDFLVQFFEGTPVALESVGNWYWIVDEIEAAGCKPFMAHALKAKILMGNVNKTDKLDAEGLATLQYLGSLPSVWLPPGELRDEREIPRTRMALSKIRTALKNRKHSTLAKYAPSLNTDSDIYAPKWRQPLIDQISSMPAETHRCMQQELELLDLVQAQINRLETRIKERIIITETMQLLKTLLGVGVILSIVIDRFPSLKNLTSYAGTVPKGNARGGKVRYGRMRKQAINYLKWAFIEAANIIVHQRNHHRWRSKYVSRVYERVCQRKGHSVAVGAVARYLSEAAYWVLKKGEPYREPQLRRSLPRQEQA